MRLALIALCLSAGPALAAPPCGGDFKSWLAGVHDEARAAGHDEADLQRFFAPIRRDPKVIEADRAQGVFRRSFTDFSRALISRQRLETAQAKARQHAALFERAARDYGIPKGLLLAFWAFETDFGAIQGNFNTVNALATLAHDCRRPDLFRPQLMAAIELAKRGGLDPATTTGAWAGEIGMVQMLPADILARAVDGDGDGRIDLKRSVPDAILSGARMLQEHGWRRDEPWLQEIILPASLDWALTGLDSPRPVSDWAARGVTARNGQLAEGLEAAILLPEGRKGPAFLAYPNFQTLFEWNKSFVYVTTAAYFATRIEGAPVFTPGTPDPGLSTEQMKVLQTKLAARGHDVGKIDGILGALTRTAVQKEQTRLGLPADAWPTKALLDQL